MAEQKTWVNGIWITEKQFNDGGSILKVSMKADKMIEFLQAHKNESGYVKINISRRREPGTKGETHTASLDTWKPTGQRSQPQQSAPAPTGGDEIEPPF